MNDDDDSIDQVFMCSLDRDTYFHQPYKYPMFKVSYVLCIVPLIYDVLFCVCVFLFALCRHTFGTHIVHMYVCN